MSQVGVGPSLPLTFHWLEPSSRHTGLQGSWEMGVQLGVQGKEEKMKSTLLSLPYVSLHPWLCLGVLPMTASPAAALLKQIPQSASVSSLFPGCSAPACCKNDKGGWPGSHSLRATFWELCSLSFFTLHLDSGWIQLQTVGEGLGEKRKRMGCQHRFNPKISHMGSRIQFTGKKMVLVVLDYNSAFLWQLSGTLGDYFKYYL